MKKVVLFGAGAAGRYALKYLREQGEFEVVAFADNDSSKWGSVIEGVGIATPKVAQTMFPDAIWVASAISRPAATEIREQMKKMGVKTKPLWECIPVHHRLPPENIRETLFSAIHDVASSLEFNDQCIFRKNPDYDRQDDPSPISELYFPDFITHLDDEVFIDCGAADGDTIESFLNKWNKCLGIYAFEPDPTNAKQLKSKNFRKKVHLVPCALSDHTNKSSSFIANADYSSSLGDGLDTVEVRKLDNFEETWKFFRPTYIKADVEGSELELLWGARKMIKEHKPVLAICAYHTSDHLWEIPLLIHAIQPDYKLYLRRYGEGAFELVWYGVPKDRCQSIKFAEGV